MSFAKLMAAAFTAGIFALLQFSANAQAAAPVLTPANHGDPIVISKVGDSNPTLVFKGVAGNQQMSAQVERDLKYCGWFDVLPPGSNADYTVNGAANGNAVTLALANAAGVQAFQVSASGSTVSMASHKAVDEILKKQFGIDGVCSTKIAFSLQASPKRKEIYTCDFDGTNYQQFSNDNVFAIEPVWSPGGKSIVYCALGGDAATLIEGNVASKRFRRLAQFPGYNGGGSISPNGGSVALILSKGDQLDLYTRSVNGSDLRRITNDKGVEATPCWSPDGSKICFVSDGGIVGRPTLFVASASGGGIQRLRGEGGENVSPSWSRDGRIVYAAKIGGEYKLAIIDLAGSSKHMTGIVKEGKSPVNPGKDIPGTWKSPSWAPDNRHVVAERSGELWVIDTWLGRARKLVGGKSTKPSQPNWSPLLY